LAKKNAGIHWTKAENPRLRYLASLQQTRHYDNLEEGLIAVEFNDFPQNIKLREINDDVKEIFRRGSCTLLAYSLHEITGLPLVMVNHPRALTSDSWEGHAGVQVEPGIIFEIGGVLTEEQMLKEFNEEYGVRLHPDAHLVTEEQFLSTILGFLAPAHPSIETTELEWLVIEDFAKHLIRTALIPHYEKHNPELAANMEQRLAAKEASEPKDSFTEALPFLPENLRIYSKSAGMHWKNSHNTRLKELNVERIDQRFEGLSENVARALKERDNGKIAVQFRNSYELTLGKIDHYAIRLMVSEANSMLALAFNDYLGMQIVSAGYWIKHPDTRTGQEKNIWVGRFGAKTADGQYLDICGLFSMESITQELRNDEATVQEVNREEHIKLATSGTNPEHFPLNVIGELEWLVVQEYAKTLAQSVLLPHYRANVPEAVAELEERLKAWETTHPVEVPAWALP
jgi:hypothetical protein